MKKDEENKFSFDGLSGSLSICNDDVISKKLAMLIDVKCNNFKIKDAVKKYGYSKQRFYQVLNDYKREGALGLRNRTPGPKNNSIRKQAVINQIIRYRFLDPAATVDVVVQKLNQTGFKISKRSVERTLTDYGLQKKTLFH
ncbi:MAG: helix-turn-helix domain containing protein [Candidatus Cloacimonetes bacterium]|nr:helix-turn-helix domain containing protein [Candidatus Cloacimonadota bacterium]